MYKNYKPSDFIIGVMDSRYLAPQSNESYAPSDFTIGVMDSRYVYPEQNKRNRSRKRNSREKYRTLAFDDPHNTQSYKINYWHL